MERVRKRGEKRDNGVWMKQKEKGAWGKKGRRNFEGSSGNTGSGNPVVDCGLF